MSRRHSTLFPGAFFGCLLFLTSAPITASAAGFELLEQSADGVGSAFAGAATGFSDGSEVYFNPAALPNLKGNVASAHLHFIMPHAQFDDKGSSYIPQLGGSALVGNNGGDAGGLELVPNAYITYHATDDIVLGFGVNSPFGLASDYNNTWVGRYHAVKTELLTVNLAPSVGAKVTDWLSVGAGLQIMYADAELTNAVDFGTIGVSTLGLPTAAQLGLLPQRADGFAEVKGDDWGTGVNLGLMVTPMEDLKIGVNWRSSVKFKLKGDADFTVPTNALPLTSTGFFRDTDGEANLDLPDVITAGVAYRVSEPIEVVADVSWVNWSKFDELRVKFGSGQPDSVQPENWDDTVRISTGVRYKYSSDLMFRTGFTWDQSPVPSEYRTPRIPDNDRYWIAFGATYMLAENLSIGANYAHIFVSSASSEIASSTGSILRGDWDLGVDVASVNLVGTF